MGDYTNTDVQSSTPLASGQSFEPAGQAAASSSHAAFAVGAASPAMPGVDTASPEWEAYRSAVYAAADVKVPTFAPGDPRAAVLEPLRPGAHHVHHSYIWLGGLASTLTVLAVALVTIAGNVLGSLAKSGISLSEVPLPLVALAVVALFVVCGGLVLLFQWLSWRNLTYELTTAEFNLFSGIISKKRMHVPYQRVQAVNQQAGIFQRALGVCHVKVETAGGAANEAVVLKYVRNSDAEALRAELFRRKKVLLAGGSIDAYGNAYVAGSVIPSAWMIACSSNNEALAYAVLGAQAPQAGSPSLAAVSGAPAEGNVLDAADEILTDVRGVFGGAEVETGRVRYETGLSNKELLLAGVSGSGGAYGAMVAGVFVAATGAMQFFQGAIETWAESALSDMVGVAPDIPVGVDQVANAMGSTLMGMAVPPVLGLVGIIAVMWVLSIIATIVKYGGFKARRRESRIEVEHGLLQRTFHGVDIDRVQSVVIKQSFVRRLMGYCELSLEKIDSAAQDSSDQQMARGVVIHPFVKLDRVQDILEGLAPEYADMPQEAVKPAPQALRRGIVRMAIIRSSAFWLLVGLTLGLAGMTFLVPPGVIDAGIMGMALTVYAGYAALFVLIFVCNVVNAVLWYRHSGMGYDRSFMRITNAGLSVKTVVLPRKKIQFAFIKTNPFQRHAGVAIVNARTAAGVGGTTELLWDVSQPNADAWMEWARPRVGARSAEAAAPSAETLLG